MLFIENKYTKIYFSIIASAQSRAPIIGYVEEHHIIPKSLGGSNHKENLVKLTAREHFICHWLLTKMVIDDIHQYKMKSALYQMSMQQNKFQHRFIPNSRVFEKIRTEWAKSHSIYLTGRYCGKDNPNYGNKYSVESRLLISNAKTGISLGPMSDTHKENLSNSMKGIKKPHASDAIKKSWEISRENRIGEKHPMHGKKHSKETKQKMKLASSNRWTLEAKAEFSRKKSSHPGQLTSISFNCEYCGKTANKGNYIQWHGDKCKMKPNLS